MGKKSKVLFLREKIMIDIERVNFLLELLADYKIDTMVGAYIIAKIALPNCKRIMKNNEKIGMILER